MITEKQIKIDRTISEIFQDMRLEYDAEFIPQSLSRNKNNEMPCLNFKVSLYRTFLGNFGAHEHRKLLFSTYYTQGIGHLKGYPMRIDKDFLELSKMLDSKNPINRPHRLKHIQNYYNESAETGRYQHFLPNRNKKIDKPDIRDVLYSLIMDSNVIECGSFEEWCDELGFNNDSIKDKKIYDECLDNALKLNSVLGKNNLEKLREVFQDY